MTNDTFDTITRSVGMDRRRSLLALGTAGLASTLVGAFGASAKKNSGKKAKKKAKKKCKKQKAACEEQVTAFCSQQNGSSQLCLAVLLPCCDECDVSVGVSCVINAFQAN